MVTKHLTNRGLGKVALIASKHEEHQFSKSARVQRKIMQRNPTILLVVFGLNLLPIDPAFVQGQGQASYLKRKSDLNEVPTSLEKL
ncbi:hypothetical protein CRM22_004689 [Opisthorchis felineus]|uniref:Uncharacterized protein n=1 Tax=Opisthorchis felineus TaxID=147828 RepID=A0A4S2LUU3_OPIFE|nr:hypothetical protein CRM22_004689 [Opisthorchis felineus]